MKFKFPVAGKPSAASSVSRASFLCGAQIFVTPIDPSGISFGTNASLNPLPVLSGAALKYVPEARPGL